MIVNEHLEQTKLEYDRALTGIRNPKVVTLPMGTAVFRFASTRRTDTGEAIPSTAWAHGAWWFQEVDYRKILTRYHAGALGLGTVARAAGAVQPSWSLMDVSIKAYLRYATEVYIGKGKTQYRDMLPNGMFVTLAGWPDIDQLYIPGLKGSSFVTLDIVRQKIVTTDGWGF
jgi:hypothetical protein